MSPWVFLSEARQRVQPLPRLDLAWPLRQSIPDHQTLELSGRWFPPQSAARLLVNQSHHDRQVKKYAGQSEWVYTFCPADLGLKPGPATLRVAYSVPGSRLEGTEEMGGTTRALEVKVQIGD